MEAGHVATTTKKRNIRKGKTKIKNYQQAVIVGVFGAGHLQEDRLVRRREENHSNGAVRIPGNLRIISHIENRIAEMENCTGAILVKSGRMLIS